MMSFESNVKAFFSNGIYSGDAEDDYFDEELSAYREYHNHTPPQITGILDPDLLSPRQSSPEIPTVKSGLLLPQFSASSDSAKGTGKTAEDAALPSPEDSNSNNSPLGLKDKSMPTSPSSETASIEAGHSAPTIANDQLVSEARLQTRDDKINHRLQKLEEENRILKNMQNELQTSFDNLTQTLQSRASFSGPPIHFLNSAQWTKSQANNIAGQQVAMQQNIPAQAGCGSFPPQLPAGLMRPPQVPGPAPKRRKGNKENSTPASSPALSPNTMARKLTSLSPQADSGPLNNRGLPWDGTGPMPSCSPEVFRKFQQLTSLIKKKQETLVQYKDKVPSNLQANFNKEFKDLWGSVGKDDAETIKKLIMYHNSRTPAASPRTPLVPIAIQVNSTLNQGSSSTNPESFIELPQSPMQLQNNYPTQQQLPGNNMQEQNQYTPHMFGAMNGQGDASSPQNNILGGSGYTYQSREQGQTMPQQMRNHYMTMQPHNMYGQPALGQQMSLGLEKFQGNQIDPALLSIPNQQHAGYQMLTLPQWQDAAPQIQIPSQQEINNVIMQTSPQKYTLQPKQQMLSRTSSANSTPKSAPRSTPQSSRKSGGKKRMAGEDEEYILGQ